MGEKEDNKYLSRVSREVFGIILKQKVSLLQVAQDQNV
jgi:hypothetical protein